MTNNGDRAAFTILAGSSRARQLTGRGTSPPAPALSNRLHIIAFIPEVVGGWCRYLGITPPWPREKIGVARHDLLHVGKRAGSTHGQGKDPVSIRAIYGKRLISAARVGDPISTTIAISSEAKAILPERASPLLQAYLDNRARLRRLVTARCGSSDEAEDVLQELYVHISRQDDARQVDNPVAYLHRMALNLARDARRSRERARRRDDDWADASQTVIGLDAIVEQPDAEAVYDGRERLARLATAIAGLPPQCHRVFTLHKLQGLSHAEIASRLGISRSAVEKHMHVALKYLVLRYDRG